MWLLQMSKRPGAFLTFSTRTMICRSRMVIVGYPVAKLIPKAGAHINVTTLENVRSLHQDLLRTAGSTGLSPKHGAVALYCLCGLLEQLSIWQKKIFLPV